ncbi:MAG: radical SAM protein [Candidatus Omnitrophica bacterium]|nr:radical SAM protein [Candidatus Omnitrophota bacterium]
MAVLSNKRILLIYPPNDLEVRRKGFNCAIDDCQNLGLAYIAAVLEKAGYEVQVIDAKSESLSIDEIINRIRGFNPAIIGLSVSTPDFYTAVSLASQIKSSGDYIILIGGRHVSALPEETMQEACFDYGIVGEGERTVVELADALSEGQAENIRQIKGLVLREGGKIVCTPPRPLIEDLDTLLLPARHLFPPLAKYPYLFYNKSLPLATIITSRGCPYQCTFCDHAVFGNRVRMRSINNILDEIEMLVRECGINEINIIDDIFSLSLERVEEFCRQLKERKLGISWVCSARCDSVNKEMLKTMKEAGCWMVYYGVESGDQRMLDISKKNITLESIRQAISWTKEAGICTAASFMLGFPGEDLTSIRNTLAFAKKLSLDRIVVAILLPLPGSELYKNLSDNGQLRRGTGCRSCHDYYFPQELPYVCDTINLDMLRSYRKKAYRDFYLRPGYVTKRLLAYREFKVLPRRINALIKTIF